MHTVLQKHDDVYFLLLGLGWPRIDEFLVQYPDRVINTEASEQTALDIAVGLCYAGKTVITYTITPFYLRAFETIRTYVNHENLPVIMVGAGQFNDYSQHDGFSHEAGDIPQLFSHFHNINISLPSTPDEMKRVLHEAISKKSPRLIVIRR